MKRLVFLTVTVLTMGHGLCAASAKFQKLTPHFYVLEAGGDQPNVGAFVGDEGILLINAPAEKDVSPVLEALKRVSTKPVRWCVSTDYAKETWGGPAPLREQGALTLASKASLERSRSDGLVPEGTGGHGTLFFDRQLHLFDSTLEVRVFSPQVKPQSADTVIFVPSEKVLQVGAMFRPGSFPTMDETTDASATLAWIDSLKQAVELVPVLKSAMPPPKLDPDKTGVEEKTLEELILVVPAYGSVSNLQEMKDLLEAAQHVRNEVTRASKAGRKRDGITGLPALAPYRSLANFEPFVLKLYDAVGGGAR